MRKLRLILTGLMLLGLIQLVFPGQDSAAAPEPKNLTHKLEKAIEQKNWGNAARYQMQIADYYKSKQDYRNAETHYRQAAPYWDKAGSPSWAVQSNINADQIATDVELYIETELPKQRDLAKFEPNSGTYLGFFLAGKRELNNPSVMKDVYGKDHAIYLTYTSFHQNHKYSDSYFPVEFAQKAKENNAGIQIGWEPSKGLDEVKDDEYVRQFAKEAKESGVPVFLRFASEMNGEWVPWHTEDPQEYIEKFRLIHDIMEEEAPNVAMVWSPNFLPRHNIDQYYPGDEYVDWVGLSLYTIPYSHGKEVPGGNPIDYLKPVYETYKHKPIIISEGAVSHHSYEIDRDVSDWAASQIGNMYGFMPRMFPQVKAITYFNLDKLTTNYDNQNNNYDLAASPKTDAAYQRMISHPYFHDSLTLDQSDQQLEKQYVPVKDLKTAYGEQNAFVYVKLPQGEQPYYVALYQGDKKLGESYAQPWNMRINMAEVNPNKKLTMIAFDNSFKRLATEHVEPSFKYEAPTSLFNDLKINHWAFEEIKEAAENNIVKGMPDGNVRPNDAVTIAQFATMLGRAFDWEPGYADAVYPEGTKSFISDMNYPFLSDLRGTATREQAAMTIAASQGLNLDADDAIKYTLVEGLSNGRVHGEISLETFARHATLSRAEAVAFINRLKHYASAIQPSPSEESDATDIRTAFKQKFMP